MTAFLSLGRVEKPADRIALIVEMCRDVPRFQDQLSIDADTLEQMKPLLEMDRRVVGRAARSHGADDQVTKMYDRLDSLADLWREIPEKLTEVATSVGADELLVAVRARAVRVADLVTDDPNSIVFDALRTATGDAGAEPIEDLTTNFVAKLLEMVVEPKTFPLFVATRRRASARGH